jgi:hypothetical protein
MWILVAYQFGFKDIFERLSQTFSLTMYMGEDDDLFIGEEKLV